MNKLILGTVILALILVAGFFALTLWPPFFPFRPLAPFMGPRMMGPGIWRGPYNPDGRPVTIDQAVEIARRYLSSLSNPDLAIAEVMEFTLNFYVEFVEKSTSIHAFESLIDKHTGTIYPEMGPNMMWNTKYGMMTSFWFSPTANMPVTKVQAKKYAQEFLKVYIPGGTVEEPDTFYGYYTIHVRKEGKIYGMLSVNGYTGEVWYHNWHGVFIQVREIAK